MSFMKFSTSQTAADKNKQDGKAKTTPAEEVAPAKPVKKTGQVAPDPR